MRDGAKAGACLPPRPGAGGELDIDALRLLRAAAGLALAIMVACASSAGAVTVEDQAVPVRQVVLDIMSFARWPANPAELRLCVVGQPLYAGTLADDGMHAGAATVRVRRLAVADPEVGAVCDAVYEGALAASERESLVRFLMGHAVLTVGEAEPGCIETTMFCLRVTGTAVSFSSNLDAIARSGVRMNPKVLLLGRRGPERR